MEGDGEWREMENGGRWRREKRGAFIEKKEERGSLKAVEDQLLKCDLEEKDQ